MGGICFYRLPLPVSTHVHMAMPHMTTDCMITQHVDYVGRKALG